MSVARLPTATSRIARPRRRLVSLVALGLWLTGAIWLVSHDVFAPQGEFGPAYRRVDAWLLMLHGALGFAALWLFGLLWGVHVLAGWMQRRRRWSGGALFGVVCLLVATGYLLYYAGDEEVRGWVSVAHWSLGLASLAAFLLHRFGGRLLAGRLR